MKALGIEPGSRDEWVLIRNPNDETWCPEEDWIYKLPQSISKTILSASFFQCGLSFLGF